MKKLIIPHVWWITLLLGLAMLLAHTFAFDQVRVDTTSIILLTVIALSPFTSAVTRIKFGDLEAEIRPKEVEDLQQAVAAQVGSVGLSEQAPELAQTVKSIQRLAESDPILALADLRLEFEKVLMRLYHAAYSGQSSSQPRSIGQLLHALANAEIFPRALARSAQDSIAMCNRAMHGEDIRRQDARSLIESSTALLSELAWYAGQLDRQATGPDQGAPAAREPKGVQHAA